MYVNQALLNLGGGLLCMSACLEQNAGQCHRKGTGPESFDNVRNLKYQGTTLTHQNSTKETLRAGYITVIPAAIRSRHFCLAIFCLKIKTLSLSLYIYIYIYIYSKTCLKRNLTGPENFSAKASFR
jgi:hypothetical protein